MPSKRLAFALLPLLISPSTAAAAGRAGQEASRPGRPHAVAPAPAQAAVPAPVTTVQSSFDAEQTRQQLETLLRQYPPTVADVLRIDPSMMTSESYLGTYPALGAFLAQHPEVIHNPAFFVGTPNGQWRDRTPEMAAIETWRSIMDGLQIMIVVITITFTLAWLVRLLLDYRRWLRLSRVQAEVHTKLLDRFTTNDELLAYIQTPAGRKFLESAPIPLEAEPARQLNAPINRILWSVQAGIVLAAGATGLLYLSGRQQLPEIAQPMFAMGVVGLAVGAGFVASAVISYLLSWRLGLVTGRPASPAPADYTGASR